MDRSRSASEATTGGNNDFKEPDGTDSETFGSGRGSDADDENVTMSVTGQARIMIGDVQIDMANNSEVEIVSRRSDERVADSNYNETRRTNLESYAS
jgi:hypothetical protein